QFAAQTNTARPGKRLVLRPNLVEYAHFRIKSRPWGPEARPALSLTLPVAASRLARTTLGRRCRPIHPVWECSHDQKRNRPHHLRAGPSDSASDERNRSMDV